MAHVGLKTASTMREVYDQVGVPMVGFAEAKEIVAHFTGIKDVRNDTSKNLIDIAQSS